MKKILLGVALAILFTSSLSAKSQEYGKNPSDWKVFTKEKGEITDDFTEGVILSGNRMKTGYRLNMLPLNKGATIIKWHMEFREYYAIYVEVYTTKGKRILRYTSLDEDRGKKGDYISFGIGSHSLHDYSTITRDLQQDLEKFELGNKILSITAFMVRGSGKIGGIKTTTTKEMPIDNDEVMIENANANPNSHWSIFTKTKGVITTAHYKYSENAIKLKGESMKTGYSLTFPKLNNEFRTVGWDMQYSENYAIYFLVNTSNGVKYLRYSSLDYDKGKHGKFISFGLGAISKDGKWHSFRRNLQKDLNKFEPNSKILSINAFMIKGSGMVDNIKAIRDSSVVPIKNFDMNKFNQLLKENRENSSYGFENTWRGNTSDEHIKYIHYTDTSIRGDDSISFYTLSSNQTELKALISLTALGEGIEVDPKTIKFNSDHTRMTFTAEYAPRASQEFPESIYQYEVLLY